MDNDDDCEYFIPSSRYIYCTVFAMYCWLDKSWFRFSIHGKSKGKSKEQEDRINYTQEVEVSGHVIYYSG